MKQSIEESILVFAITIVLAVSVSAQVRRDDGKSDNPKKSPVINIAVKTKSEVKVKYHKFEDATCASVSLGQIPLTSFWDRVAITKGLFVDATYCSRGKILNPPAIIEMSFYRRSAAGETIEPSVIFLLDATDRLTLKGKSEYSDGWVYVKFLVEPDKVMLIAKAKIAEFKIADLAYKLSSKNLAKLEDLAESRVPNK